MEPMTDPMWNYIVLGAAALFEGSSFLIALRQFMKQAGKTPFWRALRLSKDPSTYTVLAEDSAALAGLAVAALGIWASHRFEMPWIDGVASVVEATGKAVFSADYDPAGRRERQSAREDLNLRLSVISRVLCRLSYRPAGCLLTD